MDTFSGRKVVFLHIPKTAGTSIKEYFCQFFDQDEICPHWDEAIFWSNLEENIQSFRFFHGHFNHDLLQYFPNDTIVFTFLRRPLDLLCSTYHFARMLPDDHLAELAEEARDAALQARRLPLRDYLLGDSVYIARTLTNVQARKLSGSSDYPIANADWTEIARRAIDNSRRYSFVGLVENIEVDIKRLVEKFDLKPRRALARLNVSTSERQPLDEETIAAASKLIEADQILYDSWSKNERTTKRDLTNRSRIPLTKNGAANNFFARAK